MPDNATACRERLYDIWNKEYETVCKKEVSDECRDAVRFILSRNIVCGDALHFNTMDENGNPTKEPIVFSEWTMIMGTKMQRKDYSFEKLYNGEYNAADQIKKKAKKLAQEEQLSLFSAEDESPADEGTLTNSYVTDYRRVQYYGE